MGGVGAPLGTQPGELSTTCHLNIKRNSSSFSGGNSRPKDKSIIGSVISNASDRLKKREKIN
jgi:hypothetical protein